MASETANDVTVGQFIAAQEAITADWAPEDPRWEALLTVLDYSVAYGRRTAWFEIF